MERSTFGRGVCARIIILGWGSASLLLTLEHVTGEDSVREVVIGYTIPLLISSAVIVLGIWLHYQRLSHREFWRLGIWSTGSIVAMFVFETSRLLYQNIESAGVADPFIGLLHAGTTGAFVGLLLGLYDIRVQKREQALEDEREWADRLRQALLVLHRVFRHDVRTTVNVIRGNTELCRENPNVPDASIERISTQVSDLEMMATKGRRIEALAEREESDVQSIALMDLLASEVEKLGTEHPDADITLSGPESIYVKALPEIQFAFHEVVENAIVHNVTDDPEITVDVQQPRKSSTGETVTVQVRDNGPGIPTQEVDVLDAGEETQLQHSSGIGLWIVKWIIEASNGDVRYESSDQNGATISITLSTA